MWCWSYNCRRSSKTYYRWPRTTYCICIKICHKHRIKLLTTVSRSSSYCIFNKSSFPLSIRKIWILYCLWAVRISYGKVWLADRSSNLHSGNWLRIDFSRNIALFVDNLLFSCLMCVWFASSAVMFGVTFAEPCVNGLSQLWTCEVETFSLPRSILWVAKQFSVSMRRRSPLRRWISNCLFS